MDRIADRTIGVGNYLVTPQEKNLTPKDALKEGFKAAMGGGTGAASSNTADQIRPATPRE